MTPVSVAPLPLPRVPRPKPISRGAEPRHVVRGIRLVAAIKAGRSSRCAVARAWGVDESVVREVCRGDLPLTQEREDALPVAVLVAYRVAELERLCQVTPAPSALAIFLSLPEPAQRALCEAARLIVEGARR